MTDPGLKLTLKAIAALPVDERTSDEKVRLWLASPTATSEASEAGHLGFFPLDTFAELASETPVPTQVTTLPRSLSKKEKPTCPRKMVRSGAMCRRPISKYGMCTYHLSQWRKNHHPMLKHP